MVSDGLRQLRISRDVGQRLVQALEGLLGRRQLWRLGRLAYRHARRDGPNDPEISGEYRLQERIAACAAARGDSLRVIDIGANTGYWAEHMLSACREVGLYDVQLWAFEPSDDCRAALKTRLAGCAGSYRVEVRAEAVSDQPGETFFDATPGLGGSKHILGEAPAISDGVPRARVRVTTVEEILAQAGLDRVEFIKSDVEGFDVAVICGALPALRAGRIDVLQFEYNHRWVPTRRFLRDVFELLDDLPYHLCKVVPDGIDRHRSWHPELETFFEANFLLVHEDWAGPLGVRDGNFDPANTYDRGP